MPRLEIYVIEEATKRPMPYVTVRVNKYSGVSNEKGIVVFDIPSGKYNVVGFSPAYKSPVYPIDLVRDMTLTVEMKRVIFSRFFE